MSLLISAISAFAARFRLAVRVLLSGCIVSMWFAHAVHAAVPIEESVGENRPGTQQPSTQPVDPLAIPPTIEPNAAGGYRPNATTAPAPQAGAGNAASASQLSELFYRIQVLQQEIQTLRGQVEEQNYLVKRLQRDQKEQYLDIDRRVQALSSNRPPPGPTSSPPASTGAPVAGSSGGSSERQAYSVAFDAMRARQFDESIVGFNQLIENYPNGQFTPNAFYWLGELHLAKGDAEQARQSFAQVIGLYPDHQKVPDALYKLGVVYHNLNDTRSSLEYLQRVQSEYPSSSAAGLARKYAAELR